MKSSTRYWLLGLFLATASRLLAQSNAPTSLTGTAPAYNQVVLTWKDNSMGETKFEIERNNFTTFTKIGEVVGNVTTYTDNTVGGGTYRVRAILATGAPTTYSNEFTISTPPQPPTTPTSLAATAESSNSIKLTWNNGSGGTPTDYQIERGTASGGPFSLLQTVTYSRTPTFTDNSAVGGTQYCYRIRARNSGGSSNYTTPVCATPPLAPTSVNNLKAAAISSSSIKLTWDRYGKEISLSIERRMGQTGSWSRVGAATSDGGEYTDNGLSGGTEYCYRIAEEGHNYSGIACATTGASAPNAPARLTATAVSSSQINLQWADISDNETGFQIERASSVTGTFSKIADVGANTTMFSDQNLTASTQYCYRIRTVNAAGTSGYTDVQCATTPAPPVGAPQNLVATAASTTQINLTWTGVTGANSYQLERSPNGNDNWSKITDPAGSATSYSDPNLTPNTRYYYRIRAVISGTAGPYSNVTNALTPDAPPAAPARLTATAASFSQITLSWADLSANETGFQLERSTDGTTFSKVADLAANITTYSDQNLSPQTRYYYRIRAVNAAGNSDYSNVADATTPVGPPAAPQSLSAVATSTTQINLTWNAVATATNILIERSPNGTDGWSQIASVAGNVTTYADQGLNQNTRYYYRIRAVNASGNGPYSTVASAVTPDAPPTAPARLTATPASFSQINLSWADLSANESGFQIERSANGTDGWNKIADVAANVTTYADQNLSPRTRYYYRIRAVNAAGNSSYSNAADATTPDAPPAAPTRLTATAVSNSQINLSWTDGSDNETGFELERSPDGTTWTKVADLPANATTYQNTGLTPNVWYYYRVRAVNAVGQSAYSNIADTSTPDVPPAAPARLTATTTSPTQVTLAWADLSNNESGFDIERGSSATGTFTKVADVPANATTYTDQNLADNTAYCYRVRAKNAAGNSAYTDVICVTTPLAPPAMPVNLTAQVFDYDQIQLNWSLPSASTNLVLIERSTNPTSGFVEIGQRPASQTSYIDAGLQEYTTYYYRIRATNAAGNSGYSNVASARVEEVIIAIEDEFIAQTALIVHNQNLIINTSWQRVSDASLQLLTASGQTVLTDQRRIKSEDSWQYNLSARPAGVYILRIVADGRVFAKRFLLP
ncbi:fibronectin type III domain-containing protein [Spirosoma sp. KUDC1026]|uniref:fibronectin type III domain-containing protein n=1 Tax=Spirosoma sp. KUDC1026 TaxID=2745947 RepID=UPI00159BC0EF|nr:fibronectin type III domain-containing protein [Spirosoma sp. KUDC1026]QKZ13136.1 fibronectin type III domain-containing protein [Spirosoma sp. KUDC1026]